MNEIIEQIKQRASISDGAAKTALQTVVNFLKEKLPAPVASQIENVLGMHGASAGQSGGNVLGNIARGMTGNQSIH